MASIDLLRGLVMIVMALDHTRDFVAAGGFNPRDVTDPALFLTRWVTHFCAPTFVFLAGVSAFLYGQTRGRKVRDVRRFLFLRGFWLVLLEVTVVRFAWTFSVFPDFVLLQVIWVIGVSMILLAGLTYLPRWSIGALAIGLIAGHNLLDGIRADEPGFFFWLWTFLHQPAPVQATPEITVFPLYAVIPWVGVMAAGYALGPLMLWAPNKRRYGLMALGTTIILVFLTLRATNFYGDPAPWAIHESVGATILSFVNTEKYPPSFLFLAMTLGPALLALAMLEKTRNGSWRFIKTFGRVPMFFYIGHLLLIHILAFVVAGVANGGFGWLFGGLPIEEKPEAYGLGLPGVYLVWIIVLLILFLPCRWYASVKHRRTDWWLSYL